MEPNRQLIEKGLMLISSTTDKPKTLSRDAGPRMYQDLAAAKRGRSQCGNIYEIHYVEIVSTGKAE